MAYGMRPTLAQAGNEGRWRLIKIRNYGATELESDNGMFDLGNNVGVLSVAQNTSSGAYLGSGGAYYFDIMFYQNTNLWEYPDASYYTVGYRSAFDIKQWDPQTKTFITAPGVVDTTSVYTLVWQKVVTGLKANTIYRFSSSSRYVGQLFVEDATPNRYLFRKGTTTYWYNGSNFVPTPNNTTTDVDFMTYGVSTVPDVAKLNGMVILLKYIPMSADIDTLKTETYDSAVVGDIAVATISLNSLAVPKSEIRGFTAQ